MKVLAGPRLDLDPAGAAARLCRLMVGDDGEVISLAAVGLKNPYRGFSAAEVETLRGALRGETGLVGYVCRGVAPEGAHAGTAPVEPVRLVTVTDHVNLAWRSPLAGPNDDRVGPRFPGMNGVYAPVEALERVLKNDASPSGRDGRGREKDAGSANSSAIGATENTLSPSPVRSDGRGFVLQQPSEPGSEEDGMIVVRGVVAGVPDDQALSEYETETVARFGWAAVSSELVAPVIIAAHMGLRVAAVVMV